MRTYVNLKNVIFSFSLIIITIGCKRNSPVDPEPTRKDSGTSVSVQASCQFQYDEAELTGSGWSKAFEDNFDAPLTQWKVLSGGSTNNQLQHYQSANAQLKDGFLHLTAKRETVKGATSEFNPAIKTFNFTSGAIASLAKFSAGGGTSSRLRIAFRVKLPAGQGMVPTIYSSNNPWPTKGQIIMLQGQGERPSYYETNYHYGTTAGKNEVRDAYGFITADQSLAQCYHVYELEWSRSALKFYLDGKLVETKTAADYIPSLFGKEHYLFFALAVNGAASMDSIQPDTLSIDWVKVFKAG